MTGHSDRLFALFCNTLRMSRVEKASIALDTRPRRCIPIFREISESNARQDITGPASFEPHSTGQKDKESWMAGTKSV